MKQTIKDRKMVSIVLHTSGTGREIQVNTDRIMYSLPCPEDDTATRVHMDDEKFAADVKETPAQISELINAAKLRIFSPDSQAVKEEARACLAEHLRQQYAPKPP